MRRPKKGLNGYLKLPYRMNLSFDTESDAWVVRYPELPGCIAHGDTPAAAIAEGEEAKALWIETVIEEGGEVPEPKAETTYSGKLVLRLPRTLHEAAAEIADREGVSLNSYLIRIVSEGVERSGLKNLWSVIEGRLRKLTRLVDFDDDAEKIVSKSPENRGR
jgi:antitoxin HicB